MSVVGGRANSVVESSMIHSAPSSARIRCSVPRATEPIEERRVADLDGEPVPVGVDVGSRRTNVASAPRSGGPNEAGQLDRDRLGPLAERREQLEELAHLVVGAAQPPLVGDRPRQLEQEPEPGGRLLGPRRHRRRRRQAVERRVALDRVAPRGVGRQLLVAGQPLRELAALPRLVRPHRAPDPQLHVADATTVGEPSESSSEHDAVRLGDRSHFAAQRRGARVYRVPACRSPPVSRTEVAAANASDQQPVVFVHGLWMLAGSWDTWRELFAERGYSTVAVDWPDDPPNRDEALAHPEVFAGKTVGQVADHVADVVRQPADAQADRRRPLLRRADGADRRRPGLTAGAVAIDPAPFRGVLPLPFSSLKASFPVLGNPLNRSKAGDADARPVPLRLLQRRVGGGVPAPVGDVLRPGARASAVPGCARQRELAHGVPRSTPHQTARGPLLIVSGEKDNIVPWTLANAAKKRYKALPARSPRCRAAATRSASTAAGARSPTRP